jgi:hypothetical protein
MLDAMLSLPANEWTAPPGIWMVAVPAAKTVACTVKLELVPSLDVANESMEAFASTKLLVAMSPNTTVLLP